MASADPTAAAGGTPGTETDPGQQGAEAGGSSGSQDYLGRIRSDPDFAEREVRNQQSRADRLEADLRKEREWLGKLDAYRKEGFDGDSLATHLETYASWRNDPTLMSQIERYQRSGTTPDTQDDAYDGDEDVDERTRQTDARLTQHEGELEGMSSIIAQRAMTDHLNALFTDFPFENEDRENIVKNLKSTIGSWSKTAAGRESIRKLATPDGAETIRALALGKVSKESIEKAIDARRSLRKQRVASAMTDGPSGLATTGDEPPPEFKGANAALEAFEWFGQRAGMKD